MINLTVVIDNEEAIRKFRELQQTAKTVTSNVVTDADRMDIAMRRFAATIGTVSFVEFVRQLAITRGEFQQLEVAFTTLLQSKEKADALMAEMVELAAKTPFDLQGVADGARQLLAYGFSAEDITDTLTRLGNVAAGLGLPLERLTYLYGTTAVQGRLYARDMLQFTSSGIPMLQEMAQMYGKTTEEINAMVTAGKIGFEDVKKVIESMTNEGGQFYNLMQDQSKTISGLISNLGDAIDSMFNDMGKSNEGVITGVLKGTISLVENYQKVLDVLIPLISAYGMYKAALITEAAIQKTRTTIAATKAILEQTKMLTRATQAQILFNQAVKANPYALAISALSALVAVIWRFVKNSNDAATGQKALNKSMSEAASSAAIEQIELAKLKGKLQAAKEGTEEYNKVKEEIVKKFGKYDEGLKAETLTVETLAAKYNSLTDAILKSYNARQYDKFIQSQTQIFDDTASTNYDKIFNKLIKDYGPEKGNEYGIRLQKAISEGLVSVFKLPNDNYAIKGLESITPHIKDLFSVYRKAGTSDFVRGRFADWIVNIIDAQNSLKKTDELARKRFGIDSTEKTTDSSAVDAKPIISATKNLEDAQKTYNDAVKAWKAAVSGGDDIKVVNEKREAVEIAKKALDEAKKTVGLDQNTVNEAEKKQKELSDIITSNDLALQQSRIDIMKDGKQKELAIIDQATKEKLNKLEEDKEKLKKAQNGSLTESQITDFNERESNIKQQRVDERAAVELKYAKKLDDVYKQITADTLSEEDRRITGIKEKYEEFRRWVQDALDKGDITKDQASDLFATINRTEITANLNAVIEEYKTAEDKITDIQKKAANARQIALKAGRQDLLTKINKYEEENIGKINADELMKSSDWIDLFQNLDKLSRHEILRIVNNIRSVMNNANLDPVNFKALSDKLNEAEYQASNKLKGNIGQIVSYLQNRKILQQQIYDAEKKSLELSEKKREAELKTNLAKSRLIDLLKKQNISEDNLNDYLNEDTFQTLINKLKYNGSDTSQLESAFKFFKDSNSGLQSLTTSSNKANVSLSNLKDTYKSMFQGSGSTLSMIDAIIHGINDLVQGVNATINELSETADLLGGDTSVGSAWYNASTFMGAFAEASQGATDAWDSFKSGNIGGVITGVVKSFTGWIKGFAKLHDAKYERDIVRLQEKIEDLDRSYEHLGQTIDDVFSKDKSSSYDEQNKILEQQKLLIQRQIADEYAKKDTDADRIKEWQNTLEDINYQIEENKKAAVDAIFNESLNDAIENFANAYANAWTSGEDKAKSVRDEVKTMMKNMVTESIKAAMQSSQQIEAIREKLKEFYADNILTSWEQDYIYKMADALQQELDSKYGWADSIFKDDSSTSQSASTNGFQTMSQDTATELNGRFTAIQGYTAEIRDILRDSVKRDENRINEIINIRDIAIQMNNHLGVIEKHTVSITSIDEKMGKLVKIINEKL